MFNYKYIAPKNKNAIVIGGGISGTSTAYALSKRGWNVTIIERNKKLATQASGNPAGILFPQLNKQWDNSSRFYMAGFEFSSALIRKLKTDPINKLDGEFCGMFQMAKDNEDAIKLADIINNLDIDKNIAAYITQQEASDILGFNVSQGGLFFPTSGWIDVVAFCNLLANQPNITTILEQEAISLQQANEQWNILDNLNNVIANAEHVIIANAYDANKLEQCREIPLHTIGGQITYIDETILNAPLKHIICHNGYIIPAHNGKHCLGATYDYQRKEGMPISKAEQNENLCNLAKSCPELLSSESIYSIPLLGRAALRSVSKDRLPVVGALANHNAIKQQCYSYGKKTFVKDKTIDINTLFYSGLWINVAHASRGIISSPLAGEIIAAEISGEAIPVKEEIMKMMYSGRFATRELRHPE